MKQIEDKALNDLCKFLETHPSLSLNNVSLNDLAHNYLELVNAEKRNQSNIKELIKGSIKKHVEPEVKLKSTDKVKKIVRRYQSNKKK